MDMSQYMAVFLDEADEQLQQLNSLLLQLERTPEDLGILNDIFRIAHTLKGMSATMGFKNMAELTHRMESALDKFRKGEMRATPDVVDLLFKVLDALQGMVAEVRSTGTDASFDASDLVSRVEALGGARGEERRPSSSSAEVNEYERRVIEKALSQGLSVYRVDVRLRQDVMLKSARAYMVVHRLEGVGEVVKTVPPVEDLEEERFGLSFSVFVVSSRSAEEIRSLAEGVSEVEQVLVSPMALEGSSLSERVEEVQEVPAGESKEAEERSAEEAQPVEARAEGEAKPQEGRAEEAQPRAQARAAYRTVRVDIQRLDVLMNLVGELVINRTRLQQIGRSHRLSDLDETLAQVGRITSELQALVMKLRMVPVENVFDRFPRMVRDLARSQGKEVEFLVTGKETELDRTVIDEIGDPLVHLIRNAIDHGIERPEEREALGKPRKGRLSLSARHEGNSVIIEVEDDGRGMDPERIKRKAIERGIITPEEAEHMSRYEILMLTTLPGFSTAERVTEVSGRGVGLDVVKSKVESLSGQLFIESEVGRGTKISIRLPLTLAIIQALLTKVGREIYAIPLENIDETLALYPEDIKLVQNREVVVLRGQVLPLLRLRDALQVPDFKEGDAEEAVVVVRVGDRRVGLVVDELLGQEEIVIKSLGKFLKGIQGLAGATILGDGRVALILDVTAL